MGYFKGKENDMFDFINYKKEFLVLLELKNVLEMYIDDVKFNLIIFNNMEVKI